MALKTEVSFLNEMVCVRTVTYHYTGEVVAETDGWLVLDQVAWIADSGRWAAFLESPQSASEVEVYPEGRKAYIRRASVVEVVNLPSLPRETK